ncbi:ChuX/HutX family heme-like substrate-binding protein [Puniceibacterium sediminis]|uniref:Uncharacterized protein n=1 Tax=Puniceibacterium sediminis TaxID=1608407 RepID=A0A238Y7D7_9RHOB|nr:ChuX/HutX family heme-like substrate-binding protein [Puniceibacterium sediminis]SNR66701.1 hypothetical protein SAMN06265370_11517 [Puniceibacterium sediminis]
MNDDILKGHWTLVDVSAADILARLPEMDRVMVIHLGDGATHERIGTVETVTNDDGHVTLNGATHESQVDAQTITSIRLETTSIMREKVYPSLGFFTEKQELLFRVVGMEGAAPFLEPLKDIERTALPTEDRTVGVVKETPPEDLSDDPGFRLLDSLREAAKPVAIRLTRPGREQVWRGTIDAVKPVMGYSNVMTKDFHLHLKAGSVGSWKSLANQHIALDEEGQEIGLEIVESPTA